MPRIIRTMLITLALLIATSVLVAICYAIAAYGKPWVFVVFLFMLTFTIIHFTDPQ